jgi:hypothetical protein
VTEVLDPILLDYLAVVENGQIDLALMLAANGSIL